MRKLILAAVAMACAAVPAWAQSPFDGTWKVDASSAQLPDRPIELSVQGGTYHCRSCTPAWSVPADGAMHRVIGQPYFDEASVRVVDDRTIAVITRKNGQETGRSTTTVAPDGNSQTMAWRDIGANGEAATGEGTADRIGPAPAGSHAISGSWRQRAVANMSDSALLYTITTQGESFRLSFPTGESINARLGGPPVAIEGDRAGTMAAVRRLGDNGFEETDTRDGRMVAVITATLTDPNTMAFVYRSIERNTETRYIARRQ